MSVENFCMCSEFYLMYNGFHHQLLISFSMQNNKTCVGLVFYTSHQCFFFLFSLPFCFTFLDRVRETMLSFRKQNSKFKCLLYINKKNSVDLFYDYQTKITIETHAISDFRHDFYFLDAIMLYQNKKKQTRLE